MIAPTQGMAALRPRSCLPVGESAHDFHGQRAAHLRLAGYAALFHRRDAGGDVILPGAFAATLARRREPLPLLWQHRPHSRIGTVEHLGEDARGLRVVARLGSASGRYAALLRRGEVRGLSFGYRASGYRVAGADRILHAIDLFEISLVTDPLQHAARVHLIT
ncbi:HK97 family phage prohead protease [Porphyrobacter sp. GA68]|uniref:HK97 family phage prohead protease n=1 Tax=Porphyrobacter sp. GA68 TaxID=2883480 RepID=UPI0027953B7A|nr:HK97 family phage prohead protease [Porphyrobacter sp. GA68]